MKTIQHYFQNCNKDELIRYYLSYNSFELSSDKDLKDLTEYDIGLYDVWNYYYNQLDNFIEKVRTIKTEENSENFIFFVHHSVGDRLDDLSVSLIKKEEAVIALSKNEKCDSYAYEFSKIEDTAGYFVADTYLTQREIMDVLCNYIEEMTFFGFNQENLKEEQEILDERVKEVQTNIDNPEHFIPLNEFLEKISESTGWTPEKRDPIEKRAYNKLMKAQIEYNTIAFNIELKKVINLC